MWAGRQLAEQLFIILTFKSIVLELGVNSQRPR